SRRCELITEAEVKALCGKAREILIEESNVQCVDAPVTVCGDIHGQYTTSRSSSATAGMCPTRTTCSLATLSIALLLDVPAAAALKVRYPDRITLIRGNHESRQITQCALLHRIYSTTSASPIIDGKIFCANGGLSPSISTSGPDSGHRSQTGGAARRAMCDLLWSDPEDTLGWACRLAAPASCLARMWWRSSTSRTTSS
uniref:Serine/threonine-protein phosphatase n=1 Tax=Macrostomum lignano TaxID=282301 RepID=A0A1I8F5K7_9PLAT